MDRRDLLKSAGMLAMAGVAVQAMAGEHDHHHMAAAQPSSLVESLATCLQKGEACLAHCLVLLGEGNKEMAACAQSVNQMLAVCTALQKLVIQQSAYAPALAKVAMDICLDCEKECRKHEKKHETCKACAEACAACAKDCKAIAA